MTGQPTQGLLDDDEAEVNDEYAQTKDPSKEQSKLQNVLKDNGHDVEELYNYLANSYGPMGTRFFIDVDAVHRDSFRITALNRHICNQIVRDLQSGKFDEWKTNRN